MRYQPPDNDPGDEHTRTQRFWRRVLDSAPMGDYESQSLGRSIFAAVFIVAGLIGLIWFLGLRIDSERATRVAEIEQRFQDRSRLIGLQHEFSLINGTSETIAMWVREDTSPPPQPGSSILGLRNIRCTGPECGIRRTTTASFQVQRSTEDPDALIAINAWIAATGDIVYSNHMTQQELDGFSWRLLITDQRRN